MINIEQQEELLIRIGNTLSKKIEIYAIGGTAMMLRSLKEQTLDIDFVFSKKSDREEFVNTLKKLGAKTSDAFLVYGLKENTPIMLEFNNCRFDLFLNKIITSIFSDKMKERATETHEFNNLIIKVADSADILIMKSVTSRDKDLEDMVSIINNSRINWNTVVEESREQVRLGNEIAIMSLGEKLEKLANRKLITVPKVISDNLWNLFNKQVKAKAKKKK